MKLANIILCLAYLNEVYVLGLGRVFDLLVYGLTVVLFFRHSWISKRLLLVTVVFGVINVSSLLLYGDIRLNIALFFGSALLLFGKGPSTSFVLLLIRVHLISFFLQLLLYYIFNIHISIGDLVPGLDTSRNLNSDLNFYRPSGLFLEPNAFVINSAFLLILSWKYIPSRLLWTQLAAIVLSKSLFGFLFVALMLFCLMPRLLKIISALASLMVLGLVSNHVDSWASSDYITLRRVNDIVEGRDASISARLTKKESAHFVDYVLPHAVDFKNYSMLFGINGISMIIYTLGALGWLLLLLLLFRARNSIPWAIFGATLLSYPYIAYSIFYIVLRHLFVERNSS